MEVLQKLKIKLPYEITFPLLGMCTKEIKSESPRDTGTPRFIVQRRHGKHDISINRLMMKEMLYIHAVEYHLF
jgi:hypothetical protein